METPRHAKDTSIAVETQGDNVAPEQLARRKRAEQLMAAIATGAITRPEQLDPRETSPEVVHMARLQLVALGHIARKKITSEL